MFCSVSLSLPIFHLHFIATISCHYSRFSSVLQRRMLFRLLFSHIILMRLCAVFGCFHSTLVRNYVVSCVVFIVVSVCWNFYLQCMRAAVCISRLRRKKERLLFIVVIFDSCPLPYSYLFITSYAHFFMSCIFLHYHVLQIVLHVWLSNTHLSNFERRSLLGRS